MNADELTSSERVELERLRAERDEAKAKLRDTQKMLQAVMDNLPEHTYWKNKDRKFVGCNKLFAEVFGIESPEKLIGRTEEEICSERESLIYGVFLDRENEVMSHGIPQYHSIDRIEKEGHTTWLDTSHVPLFKEGEIVGILGSFEDITDRVAAEEELRKHRDHLSELVELRTKELEQTNWELEGSNRELEKANEALQTASQAKSQFVANISHEFRTPLNAVVAMTELMLEGKISPIQQEYLTTILESSDNLLFMINDLLDFSKIEAGKLDLDITEFNCRDTIESLMKSVSVKAHEKGLELIVEIEPDTPSFLFGDPLRLRQILTNLLGNAIKFTDKGEIELSVKKIGEVDGKVELEFDVSDTGVGIPKDRQAAIFNAFEQGDNSTTRNFGGSGLGLSIVSQLVKLMDGEISLTSDVGRGSVFKFTALFGSLDFQKQPEVYRDPEKQFIGQKVVLIDDNVAAQLSISNLLKRWGFKVEVFSTIESWNQSLATETLVPELLIVDSELSGMERSLTLLVQICEKHPNLPILFTLATGKMLNRIEQKPLLKNADFIFKPIIDFELLEKVRSKDTKKPSFTDEGDFQLEDVSRNEDSPHILLVDDRGLNQKIGKSLLDRLGYRVSFASDGLEAVEMTAQERFDLILMDVQMPKMDGYEAARTIRKREKITGLHVPIVAVTANALKGEGYRTASAGMDGYLSKPIRLKPLKEMICNFTGD